MIFTSEMLHLTVVVLKDRAGAVSKELLRLGAVEFDRLQDIEPDFGAELGEARLEERLSALSQARKRIEDLVKAGGQPLPVISGIQEDFDEPDVTEINRRLDHLARDIEERRSRQGEIQRKINRIADVRRQLRALNERQRDLAVAGGLVQGSHQFLHVCYGRIDAGTLPALHQQLNRYSGMVLEVGNEGNDVLLVAVFMKRNASDVDQILATNGFRASQLPLPPEEGEINALSEAESRIETLRREQQAEVLHIETLVRRQLPELQRNWRLVRIAELLATIRGASSESAHATVFSGWVPARSRRFVEDRVRTVAEGACHLEWHDPEDIRRQAGPTLRVPVELRNPRLLLPFQLLVTNYGIPDYRTIDPTPLVAVAYLLMFGLMFGDAGHGLVLLVLGLIGARTLQSPSARQISRLVVWCGGASVVMGVLFGAYFGMELLPALWFNYHGVVAGRAEAGAVQNLLDILRLTIYLGIAVIAAGLVINWINRFRRREWRLLVFEKEGLLGGFIYAAGVWIAGSFAQSGFRTLPDLSIAGPLIGIPVALLFLKFPLEARSRRREGLPPQSPAMWVMDWVIEILEVFSGYLANTLSFMRVAGLGIAHVMLMVAFFQIADMVSPQGLSVLAVAVLVFGNILVIALEGLSAGIQSLRLNYYEFFSKHFVPTGVRFRPVSLETNTQGG